MVRKPKRDRNSTTKVDIAWTPESQMNVFNDEKTYPKAYAISTSLAESNCRRYENCLQRRRTKCHRTCRHHHSPTPSADKPEYSESGLKDELPVSDNDYKTVYYRSRRFIHKLQRSDEDVTSEMWKISKKVPVQMKDQTFYRNYQSFYTTFSVNLMRCVTYHKLRKFPKSSSSDNL